MAASCRNATAPVSHSQSAPKLSSACLPSDTMARARLFFGCQVVSVTQDAVDQLIQPLTKGKTLLGRAELCL